MSDIQCPFCMVRYPPSELIIHCKVCRQKKSKKSQQHEQGPAEQEAPSQPEPRSLSVQSMHEQVEEPVVQPKIAKPPPKAPREEPQQPEELPIHGAGASAGELVSPTEDEADGPREECDICGRWFAEKRIEKHRQVCSKQRARKPFDAAAKRHEDLSPDEKKLVHKDQTARQIDKSARVKANKLMWDADQPVEQFGDVAKTFKAVYDDTTHADPVQESQDATAPKAEAADTHESAAKHQSEATGSAKSQAAQPAKSAEAPISAVTQPELEKRRHKKHSSSGKQAKLLQLQQLMSSIQGYQQPQMQMQPMMYQQPAPMMRPMQQMPQMQSQGYNVASLPPPQMAPQQRFRFCVYCGTQYVEGAAFCGVCGAKRIE